MSPVFMAILYLAVAAAVAGAASWLRRPIPVAIQAICVALPVLFLLPGFLTEKTVLPVDHAVALPPWKTPATPLPRNPNLNDVVTQFAPWAKAVRMAWKEGELPLRDRWNGCGAALAANGTSAAFSPLTLLTLLLPLARAFTLAAAVRLLLALAGTWLWLTELEVSETAALFGAVAFAFSLAMTAWLLFPQTAVLALWPWALFAVERLRRPEAAVRSFALLASVFALWPLCGHIESAASGAVFLAVWLASRFLAGDLREAPRLTVRVAAAAALALGLSAFALLPQAVAISASNRLATNGRPFWGPRLSWLPHGPAWPRGLLLPLFPAFFGDGLTEPMRPGGISSYPEMALGSIGIVGWAAALLVLRPGSTRSRAGLALTGPLAAGLGVAVGQWPFAELAAAVPGLKWMFPLRFFTWAALAGAALAAFELDRLGRDLNSARTRLLVTLGLAGLCGIELFAQGRRLYAFGSPGDLFPDRPLLAFLRGQPGPFRVVGEEDVLFPNTNVFAGLEDVRTHDAVERRDYVEYLDRECGYEPSAYFKNIRDLNCRALDLLNVRYLISRPGRQAPEPKWTRVYSGDDGTVFENRAVLPRVFGQRVGISGYRETTNTASFQAAVASGSGDAVLAASLVQDGGWSAGGGGSSFATGRTNGGPFLTINLPPGDHEVRLTYRPPGWRPGLAISLAALVLSACLAGTALARTSGSGRASARSREGGASGFA